MDSDDDFIEDNTVEVNAKPEKKVENFPNLLSLMHKGDEAMQHVRGKLTFIMGKTRTGKSTFFNWACNLPLIGYKLENGEMKYKLVGITQAEVAAGFKSVTLVPNIEQIAKNEFFLDMAGFKDEGRNGSAVLAVSFMIKAALEKGEEVRFILVATENSFCTQDFLDTLELFLSLFKFFKDGSSKLGGSKMEGEKKEDTNLPETIRKKLFSSVRLMVTQSRNPLKIYEILKGLVDSLKMPVVKNKYRRYMYEMLKNIEKGNRFDAFPLAQENCNAPSCPFFQEKGMVGWEYFSFLRDGSNLLEDQSEIKPKYEMEPEEEKKYILREEQRRITEIQDKLISLPFTTDYSKLSYEDQQEFQRKIANRVSSFKDFSLILKQLMKEGIDQSSVPSFFLKELDQERKELLALCRAHDRIARFQEIIKNAVNLFKPVLEDAEKLIEMGAESNLSEEHYQQQKAKQFAEGVREILSYCKQRQLEKQELIDRIAGICNWTQKHFAKLQDYIQGHDFYEGAHTKPKKEENSDATGLDLMNSILRIFDSVINVKESSEFENKQLEYIEYLFSIYPSVFEVLRSSFCGTYQDYKTLNRVDYILRRGEREFKMLYSIATQLTHHCAQSIQSSFAEIFDETRQILMRNFVLNLNTSTKKRLLSTQKLKYDYIVFLQKLRDTNGFQDQILYSQNCIDINMLIIEDLKADTSKNLTPEAKNKDILKRALEGLTALEMYEIAFSDACQEKEEDSEGRKRKTEDIGMRRISMLYTIKESLLKLNSPILALNICQLIKCPHSISLIMQQLIETETADIKKHYLRDYAKHCEEWGRPEKAVEIYQELISIEDDYSSRKSIMADIEKLHSKPYTFPSNAKEFYKTAPLVSMHDQTLKNILKKIRTKVLKEEMEEENTEYEKNQSSD